MSDTRISEEEFETLADRELHDLVDALIESGEEVDPDLESGVLTINFDDGAKYIVNSHRAARQIWMAANRQAWHFDYAFDDKSWRASQSGDELWTTLDRVLGAKLGTDVKLQKP